ncbi:urease accessory protein UreE [Marinibacterium anthonyi]|nr:urease accessory protein UreE [Marinibacterium anthonyi]
MLRVHGILGHSDDPDYHAALHRLEHRDGIEYLFVPAHEAGRKRFRLTTDRGTDCAVSIDRDQALFDGAVLAMDETRAIVARFGAQEVWRLKPRDTDAALQLGWHAGNLHWRVCFDGEVLEVLLDGARETYRARIADLIAKGLVRDA